MTHHRKEFCREHAAIKGKLRRGFLYSFLGSVIGTYMNYHIPFYTMPDTLFSWIKWIGNPFG